MPRYLISMTQENAARLESWLGGGLIIGPGGWVRGGVVIASLDAVADGEYEPIRVGVPEPGYQAPLIPRCCRSPRPVPAGLIEYISAAGRTQKLYCLTCRAVIAHLTWNVEMP
jgi:hypothetical protein